MTDTRTLENHFLGTLQAMVGVACTTRQFQKALVDLPESVAATQTLNDALLAGIPKERLRTIAKASQGDSRRGREMAARLSEWIDAPREIAKASTEGEDPDEGEDPENTGDEDPEGGEGGAEEGTQDATRTAIKALRERYEAEGREVAKAHHAPTFRTVNGKRVQVAGYDTTPTAKAAFAHMASSALARHPEHGKAQEAHDLTGAAREATRETAHPDEYGVEPNDRDHHSWAADAHDRAYSMHSRIASDLKDSSFPESRDAATKHLAVAKAHKDLQAHHSGIANRPEDTTPALNENDNMGQHPKKEVIHPKTDMVD